MFLADKASDDGTGIYCSKGTVQRHTELGASTVKRTINDFIQEGILVETGQIRRCTNGYTVVYRMDLSAVEALERISEPPNMIEYLTHPATDRVQGGPGTGPSEDRVPVPERTPNHPKTIHKPPARKRETAAAIEIEKILTRFPADRIRDRPTCLSQIEIAIEESVAADELHHAVTTYAAETEGFTRSRVCFSDNWFKSRRWQTYVEELRSQNSAVEELSAAHQERLVSWITNASPMCKHITPTQVAQLRKSAAVSDAALRAVGLLK
ncbi:MAG: hypothetical protein ABJF50_22980 [Paracoccaceae bacterium]